MKMIEFIKKRYVLVALILLVIVSASFAIRGYIKLNSVNREVTGVVSEFEPSHECKGRGLSFYCFSLSSTMKTCYTLPNRQGGKRCLEEQGLWQKIIYEEPLCPEPECPECEICREPEPCPILNITCPVIPCIQSCKGCGGGSCSPCPTTCPPVVNCENINCIAYVDMPDGSVNKYFCDSCSPSASCVLDGTLEMPWG